MGPFYPKPVVLSKENDLSLSKLLMLITFDMALYNLSLYCVKGT